MVEINNLGKCVEFTYLFMEVLISIYFERFMMRNFSPPGGGGATAPKASPVGAPVSLNYYDCI